MEIIGVIAFIIVFIVTPIQYSVFLVRNDKTVSVPTIDFQRIKCESPIETILYNALKNKGYNIETQVRCGKYRIDMTLPLYKLAIECDGKEFHSNPEQKAHDRKKNAYLRRSGWSIMRIKGSQIHRNLPKVIQRIEKKINKNMGI
jgi:very-short-patch-repair endonuclease